MKYRNNEYCITPEKSSAEAVSANTCVKTCDKECSCDDIMKNLSELQFAAIDLNLYLDTHPHDEEALKMFKKVTKTMETVKVDYIRKYGPLKACDSADEVPFEWTSCKFKWPWEK